MIDLTKTDVAILTEAARVYRKDHAQPFAIPHLAGFRSADWLTHDIAQGHDLQPLVDAGLLEEREEDGTYDGESGHFVSYRITEAGLILLP